FRADVDFSHSNIQDFGIAGYTSVTIRNVFKGAETLELSVRGEIGSSSDAANPNDNFFNISEIGADAKLNFPRLFLPFKTDKIIPKTMLPHTTFSLGSSKQTNIGLDKQNLTNSFSYYWTPKKNTSFRLDLLNIQYVRNINPDNYYTVYESSYNELNDLAQKYNADPSYFDDKGNLIIPEGVENFLDDVNQGSIVTSTEDKETINSIEEQQQRLTENNLIFATNISFSKSSKKDLLDNSFYTFRAKFESAGNFLSLLTKAANQEPNTNGSYSLFGVTFSQYLKGELEFIKHWDLSRKKVFATRAFFGVAIPYGNMNSVPFSRSYFGGGSNDIRAWQPYSLGPGKTESVNDYNEANMKMTVNAELRFPFFFQQLNAALFIDAGNIWHVSDIVTNPDAVFSGIKSFENTAIGSGFGFNYDFNFFVIRLDFGFKTYNPARPENEKWFKEMRFDKTVLNIGINYPF
ncbi:MAG: BamA/TamA family outer membrane protein, partial [Flavobacterium sp.]